MGIPLGLHPTGHRPALGDFFGNAKSPCWTWHSVQSVNLLSLFPAKWARRIRRASRCGNRHTPTLSAVAKTLAPSLSPCGRDDGQGSKGAGQDDISGIVHPSRPEKEQQARNSHRCQQGTTLKGFGRHGHDSPQRL
ncbi:MAG: hypothetical protein PVTTEEND_001600 [Candidatus Fervidibacter sp.]